MRRAWILILAALALGAPSCPRETGPGDYDPDATRPFTGVPADSDLVYLSAGSTRGDVVYVVAANTGATVGHIDGPDRLSWALDPAGRVGYYAVTRREGTTTLHRIELRSGVRRLLARDDRARAQSHMLDDGWRPTALAVSGDGVGLLVARALASGSAWVGRYDTTTGALTEQIAWPLQERSATVRLDRIGGERFVVVVTEARDGVVVRQHLHVIDGRLRALADIAPADLPATAPCASRLVPLTEGWGTICSGRHDRYPAALVLDAAFRPLRTITLPVGPAEQMRAHAAVDGDLAVLTDRGRWTIARGASATLSLISLLDGRTTGSAVLFPLGATDEGLALAHVVGMGEPSDRTLTLIDLARGRTIAERRLDGGLLGAAIGREVYALVIDGNGSDALRLWRFDRATLEPRAATVTVPQRDLTVLNGIAVVATVTKY